MVYKRQTQTRRRRRRGSSLTHSGMTLPGRKTATTSLLSSRISRLPPQDSRHPILLSSLISLNSFASEGNFRAWAGLRRPRRVISKLGPGSDNF